MKNKIKEIKPKEIICLNITSWSGVSIGAEHYYGKMKPYFYDDEREEIELERKITEISEARYLSKKLGYKGILKVGSKTNCFATETHLIQECRKQYKKYFPGTKVIVLGDRGICAPQCIILGPRTFKKINNSYWRAYSSSVISSFIFLFSLIKIIYLL